MDSLKPGHRFEHEIDAGKRFHADWALWKFADPARREMVWDSPWGPGFPGWHIECSAMSIHYLDRFVDVHVGGIDLRFPHHENERAQSDAATGQQVVRHWVHGEHLFEGRKMAKSTGNVILLDDIVGVGHDPLALRLVPRAPLPRAAEPDLGDHRRCRPHADPLADRGGGLGRVAEWPCRRRCAPRSPSASRTTWTPPARSGYSAR